MRIPITSRAKQYGYVFWPKAMDAEVKRLLGDRDVISVWFDGKALGEKRIDWKRRRISVGQRQTQAVSGTPADFVLSMTGGALTIQAAS